MILALGDYMSVQCHACIGGTNVGEDIRKLDYGQHVVAGTPGRVFGICSTLVFLFMWNIVYRYDQEKKFTYSKYKDTCTWWSWRDA